MKKFTICFALCLIFLTGCTNDNSALSQLAGSKKNEPLLIGQITETPEVSDLPIVQPTEASAYRTYKLMQEETEYTVRVFKESGTNYSIKLFDSESKPLQSIALTNVEFESIYFQDVNWDEYMDMAVIVDRDLNPKHELYTWDTSNKNFDKVTYEGFESLSDFAVRSGYLQHYIREEETYGFITQQLTWNGNALVLDTAYSPEPWYGESAEIFDASPLQLQHEQDGTEYFMEIMQDTHSNFMLYIYDPSYNKSQEIRLRTFPSYDFINFQDLNLDGYTDIVITNSGTPKETQDLFLFDPVDKKFNLVIQKGIDAISYFEVHDGYLMNWQKSDGSSCGREKLIWDGNMLIKE
jgi:outer membrane lipoprotein-sorting protein